MLFYSLCPSENFLTTTNPTFLLTCLSKPFKLLTLLLPVSPVISRTTHFQRHTSKSPLTSNQDGLSIAHVRNSALEGSHHRLPKDRCSTAAEIKRCQRLLESCRSASSIGLLQCAIQPLWMMYTRTLQQTTHYYVGAHSAASRARPSPLSPNR